MTLAPFASLRLTLGAIVLLAAGVVVHALAAAASSAWIVVPLALLAANLAAAIFHNRAFRGDLPLLMFHIALLAVVLLAAAGRLSSLTGQLELAEGEVFGGQLAETHAGPLHAGHLQAVRFVNDGFTIRYAPGLRRSETRNPVRVFEPDGRVSARVIGDNEPLRIGGYRFYTSFNKGFSLVFRWFPRNGAPERGTVNLPAYPANEHRQALDWRLPGEGPRVWTLLQFDRPPLDPDAETFFRKPGPHHVVLRAGDRRWELGPGEQVALDGGVLAYEGATTWMGYNVFYDWTLPWLLAACGVAIACLGWHFARRFARTPWDA